MERCDAGLSFWIVGSGVHENANAPHPLGRRLRPRRERPRRRAADERDELASSWVEHGLLPGTRCASLPQAQDAPEAPAGQPISLRPLRKAATRDADASREPGLTRPMTGTAGCCARAATGHAAAPPSSVMNSRRFIRSPRRRWRAVLAAR